ncbi:TLC domain-containing protein [Cercophora scortea]|uniref:TLC domain-containing protein n=1 Tax=Cercophora scortea TaxID=314031 RepID=A0AAE0MEC5_9PEZI|nr:TLC domain-containing protein [Cercophora scortea]
MSDSNTNTPDAARRSQDGLAQPPKTKTPALSRPLAQTRNSSMNGPLYNQVTNKIIIRRTKRKGDGPLKHLARWMLDNQTGLSFNLIALLFLAHACFPKARPFTSKFFMLQYYNPVTEKYAAGHDDFYFMAFCIVALSGLRAGAMEYILAPLGKLWGIAKRKDVTRFSEQGWLLAYYYVFWPLGMYLYYKSPYFLNMPELWTNWPQRELDGLMKGYIMVQLSFWVQQVIVINIEDRRKDHWQMLTHHFATIGVMTAAYAYHQTRVANQILLMMDIIDLIFPLAKCLKYLGFTTLCDVMFGVFIVMWLLARHAFFLMTCWSVYTDIPRLISSACYKGTGDNLQGPLPVPDDWSHLFTPFSDPEGLVCWNDNIMYGFLTCLLFLQGIMIMWFGLIARVAINVLKGKPADDVRSDDEGEDEEEEEYEYEEAEPLEEEVGVEAIDLKGWERRTRVERTASSTSVSLPGHSDRKEFLNRIGCEKQID